MRGILVALALAALSVPALGRAAPLRLGAPGGQGSARAGLHLDVPALALEDGPGALHAGSGAGASGVEPAVALILGIFPGFGLGHYVAGSAAWTNWLVIDVVLLVALVVVSAADVGVLVALGWIATVVERVIEGLDAYHRAGGPRIASAAPPREPALAYAPSPPRERAPEASARAELLLARF